MPRDPPLPLYSEFNPVGPQYRLIFDQPLLPGATTQANYDVTYGDRDYDTWVITIVANRIEITGPGLIPFTPPNGISYHATPPELFGLTGVPVPPLFKIPFV